MRILGVDYGDKKVGFAFGDSQTSIAVPLDTYPNENGALFDRIVRLVEADGYERIVVGVPLSTGVHHSNEQLKKTQNFIENLRASVTIPVDVEDESYTTTESIRLQQEEGMRYEEDAIAAMLIVRAYLERIF